MYLSCYRDLVIVILGALLIAGSVVFFIIIIGLIGHIKKTLVKTNELLDSAKETVGSVKDTVNIARDSVIYARDQLVKPFVELAAMCQMVQKVAQTVKNFCCSIRGNRPKQNKENVEPEVKEN